MKGNKFAVGQPPNRTAFKKGNQPWNAGLKGWSAQGSEKTRFVKGSRPKNYTHVGTITIRVDRNKTSRRWIKVSDVGPPKYRWKLFAQWLWEKKKGAIPAGLVIHHLDKDSLNDQISNYGLVTRAVHMQQHREELDAGKIRRKL